MEIKITGQDENFVIGDVEISKEIATINVNLKGLKGYQINLTQCKDGFFLSKTKIIKSPGVTVKNEPSLLASIKLKEDNKDNLRGIDPEFFCDIINEDLLVIIILFREIIKRRKPFLAQISNLNSSKTLTYTFCLDTKQDATPQKE